MEKEDVIERIEIDHFYIEGIKLFAVEKPRTVQRGLMLDGPPRIFSIEGRDEFGNATDIEVIEINYR